GRHHPAGRGREIRAACAARSGLLGADPALTKTIARILAGRKRQGNPMQEMKPRLNYFKAAPALFQAQLALNKAVEDSGLDRGLLHLIKVRASQINGCAYCL